MQFWTTKKIDIHHFFPTVLLSLLLSACGGGGTADGNLDNVGDNPVAGSNSPFEGVYTGQFAGTDSGTWELTIDQDGNASGSATTTTLPVVTIPLSGAVDASGTSTLVSGTAGVDVIFMITIANGVVTGTWADASVNGGGTVTGGIAANTNISGSFSVGVEINNYTFTPLKVIDLTSSASILSVNNDNDPVNPAFYDSHGLTIIINPLDGNIAAISYSYFNTGPNSMVAEDYVYLLDCVSNACPSVSLDLNNRTLSFVNTDLPVDNSPETKNRPNVTNIATIPATISGSISW